MKLLVNHKSGKVWLPKDKKGGLPKYGKNKFTKGKEQITKQNRQVRMLQNFRMLNTDIS